MIKSQSEFITNKYCMYLYIQDISWVVLSSRHKKTSESQVKCDKKK